MVVMLDLAIHLANGRLALTAGAATAQIIRLDILRLDRFQNALVLADSEFDLGLSQLDQEGLAGGRRQELLRLYILIRPAGLACLVGEEGDHRRRAADIEI